MPDYPTEFDHRHRPPRSGGIGGSIGIARRFGRPARPVVHDLPRSGAPA